MSVLHRTWAVVDLDALRHNACLLSALLPANCQMMGVVKADGYGHGDLLAAKALAPYCSWFGVSNLEEGLALRKGGLFHPVLVLGATPPEEASRLLEGHITPAVYSLSQAVALSRAVCGAKGHLPIHIKADTGMGRLGFPISPTNCTQAVEEICKIAALPGLTITGLFTHFSMADDPDPTAVAYTENQIAAFSALRKALGEKGLKNLLCHACNSAGMLHYPQAHLDMVRPGTALYGFWLPGSHAPLDLHPCMEVYSTVSMVKTLPAGKRLSYGGLYTTEEPSVLATVAIGYADGYRRDLTGKATVLIGGQVAPVVGRICMDQLLVDVSHLSSVQMGDLVTMVGQDESQTVTFQGLADAIGSVPIELTCGLSKRVPRLYRLGGRVLESQEARVALFSR